MHRGPLRLRLALATVLVGACTRAAATDPALPVARPDRKDRALTAEQRAWLDTLARRAEAAPAQAAVQKAAGLAFMQFTLSGVLSLQVDAERYLETAFALDPGDRELTRSLGRFYNMRAVDGDFSKADMQVAVYAAHLGEQDPRAMSSADFVAYSFAQLGHILTLRNRGNLLGALSAIGDFEDLLRERTADHPDDIELFALAGNFEVFFAGNVPMGKRERVRAAVGYFEVLRARWDELRPGARDEIFCPNTRENFMFELAEAYLVLEQPEQARPIYEELRRVREPVTRAKEQIAWIAAERLRNEPSYLGDMDLMPPWPGDVANCVVCHSWTADVSLRSLHAVEPVRLQDIPSRAAPKPVPAR